MNSHHNMGEVPSIEYVMIKNKKKHDMSALKWSCMWAVRLWERMGRSLSRENSEKNGFGCGMNGRGRKRNGFTGLGVGWSYR